LEKSPEFEAVLAWFDDGPHSASVGKLVSRSSLLQICLGLGILIKDATQIQCAEDNIHPDGTPPYIQQSVWGIKELDEFKGYAKRFCASINRSQSHIR